MPFRADPTTHRLACGVEVGLNQLQQESGADEKLQTLPVQLVDIGGTIEPYYLDLPVTQGFMSTNSLVSVSISGMIQAGEIVATNIHSYERGDIYLVAMDAIVLSGVPVLTVHDKM